jgi:hypothetical protein
VEAAKQWIEIREHEEKILAKEFFVWKAWGWNIASIVTCLSATRPALLLAAASRVATENRGEAILAALKITSFEGMFDKHVLGPGDLPIALLNKVIQSESRAILDTMHEPVIDEAGNIKWFFSDILPTTAAFVPEITERQNFIYIVNEEWHLDDDGFLHLCPGSIMQSLNTTESETTVVIYLNIFPANYVAKENNASAWVTEVYEAWRKRIHVSPEIMKHFPASVRTAFLPFAVRLNPQVESAGIILVSNSDVATGNNNTWYKCGRYQTISNEFYRLEEEIVIGRMSI